MEPKHLSISWYKDSQPLVSDSQFRVSGEMLNIFQPSGEKSSGIFTCVVQNGETNTSASYIVTAQEKVNIIEPPNVLQRKIWTEITCAHNGFPKPTVEWFKDSVKITTDQVRKTIAQNGSLILRGTTSEDSGRYSCHVFNQFTSNYADANLTVRASPEILNKSPISIGILGEPFNLRCRASGGPKPTVHWKHINNDILPNSHLWTGDDGLLSINKIVRDDSAQFKCVAVNSIGESDVWITNLTVMERPSATIYPLVVENAPAAVFNCTVKGDPMPSIIWKVPSRGIFTESNNTAKVYVGRSRISIAELTEKDDGIVECIASNPAANTSAQGRVIVYVKPRKLVEPQDLFVVEGSEVDLYWPVYGKPSPDISWYKDGNPLDMSHGYQITNTGIEFTAKTPETHGIFRMQANNEKGNTIGEAWVRVVRIYDQPRYTEIMNGTVRLAISSVPTVWQEPNIVFELWVVRYSGLNSTSTDLGLTQLDAIDVGYEATMNMSEEFNQTSGYIAVEYDQTLPEEIKLGDGASYRSDFKQETVFNGPIAQHEWFAIYLKTVSYVRNPDLEIRILGVTKYLVLYTENSEFIEEKEEGLSTAAIVLLCIFILLVLAALLFCCGYKYKKGKFPLGPLKKMKRNIPNWRDWPQYLCKKGDVEGPIDVRAVLPQFNSTSTPNSIRVKIGTNNPGASTSTLYIPTEDEIERLERLGIHYYDDDNWITQVPKGVLNVHSKEVQAALKRGQRPPLNDHLSLERSSSDPSTSSNKRSPVESLKTFERTASDPMVVAEELENRLMTQCHVNKAYENTTEDVANENKLYSKKGSPVKNSRGRGKMFDDNHSSVNKSISAQSKVSRDSRTDSGFDSGEQWAKKKGLTPQSGSWTSKPKDIVSIMQHEDTVVKPQSSPMSNPATPNRNRRKERKRRDRAKRTEKSKGIWSRGKKWAKRYVLDKHIDDDALSSTGYSESEFESSANSKYKPMSHLSEQRQNNTNIEKTSGPKVWDDIDLESSYIDPSSIVSVPKVTSRIQHLQEHKDDVPGVTTTAFVHRKSREEETSKADRKDSSGGQIGRATAIRRGQFPEPTEQSSSDVKISNLETGNYTEYSSYDNRSYQDDDYGFDEDYIDDELVEWEDETVTMVDTTLPQKSFESYRQAYLDNVADDTTLAPTVTAGIPSLPYDILSEKYLNEEIAAEKAAEEEKRKAKIEQARQANAKELPETKDTASNKNTYVSLLDYAEDGEKYCKICGIDHYPICEDMQPVKPEEAPTPPPRPDLTEEISQEEALRSKVPATETSAKIDEKSTAKSSSKQSSIKSTVSQTKVDEKPIIKGSSKQSSIKSNVSLPNPPGHRDTATRQLSLDEMSEPPVYVNLDEVNMKPSTVPNPPPLPPRQGSLHMPSKGTPADLRSKSTNADSKPENTASQPEHLGVNNRVSKGVSPLIKRKLQQFDEAGEEVDTKKISPATNDTPTKSKKHPPENIDAKRNCEEPNIVKSMPEKNEGFLTSKVDIQIQPATPIHKTSRLEAYEAVETDGYDSANAMSDYDERQGSFERIGSVAERRKLFERPIAQGHERASARSFHLPMTKGPDRASTRSMDYQMKGKPSLALSIHEAGDDLVEEKRDSTHKIPVEITDSPTEKVSFSKRMALFEGTNVPSKTSSDPDLGMVTAENSVTAAEESLRNNEAPSTTQENTQHSVAKETQQEVGWKLHPDKVKIPDIFK